MYNVESESAEWISATQVQEQQWLAETVGRLYKLLSILLQKVSGISCCISSVGSIMYFVMMVLSNVGSFAKCLAFFYVK